MIPRAHAALAALVACLVLLPAAHVRAGTEEFSTFDVEAQEEDDESLLDHFLTRMPHAWRDEWERAPQAIRTSQGCLTSGQWFIDTDLRLHAPLGRRARFGLEVRQSESDAASYEYFDFSFQFPTRFGTPGLMFRPLYDKSRQDFAATWELGADTSAYQLQAAFTFEDLFNNFWAFRQTRVGRDSEPYYQHPYEPALRMVARRSRWRAEVSARWLTPSTKHLNALAFGAPERRITLWGTLGTAGLEVDALGIEWEARTHNQQALGTEQPLDLSTGNDYNFRRRWSAEIGARRGFGRRIAAEAHWVYQDRDQRYGPPLGPGSFRGIDRMIALETTVALTSAVSARAGGLYDRLSIAKTGVTPWYSYGSRTESRAYIGLIARFGRVRLHAIEGIELDPEPYDVWGVHDKGFFQLQTTF